MNRIYRIKRFFILHSAFFLPLGILSILLILSSDRFFADYEHRGFRSPKLNKRDRLGVARPNNARSRRLSVPVELGRRP